ncbi:MAG: transposase, partial [Wolbachia sp.]
KEFIAYEQEIKRIRDERAVLEQKLDDAKKEGKIEVAKTMLANNVDINIIVQSTGLSINEIEKLSGNL